MTEKSVPTVHLLITVQSLIWQVFCRENYNVLIFTIKLGGNISMFFNSMLGVSQGVAPFICVFSLCSIYKMVYSICQMLLALS